MDTKTNEYLIILVIISYSIIRTCSKNIINDIPYYPCQYKNINKIL